MQFSVRAYRPETQVVTQQTVEGESEPVVRMQLEQAGWVVLAVRQKQAALWKAPHRHFNVILFCEELRTLLSSGMSLVEAVETLGAKARGAAHPVLDDIRKRLLEGKAFSAALMRNPFPFPILLVASIQASEKTSRIDQALDEYIAYDKVGQELRKKIVSAAIYPGLVVSFGFLVCFFMLSYVVPRFAKVYEDFSQNLSVSTLALMKAGQFAGEYWPLMLAALVALAGALVVAYRSGRLQRGVLTVLGQFRFTRDYARIYQLSRIFQTVSMLLRGGYTLVDALPLAANLSFDPTLREQLDQVRIDLVEGKRLSAACVAQGLTDSVTERLLQVGERSGNLEKVLDIIALNYRQSFTRFVDHATRLAEPLLLLAVGLMVGMMIILMYMPVFDLAGGM